MRALLSVLTTIAVVTCLGLLVLYFGQRWLLFPAPNVGLAPIRDSGVEVIELELGRALLALPLTQSERPAPLLVFAHGNAEVAQWSLEPFLIFRRAGFALLLLEYPGYGGAPGRPSSESLNRAALLALDSVAERPELDLERLVVYGRSIGSGVACHVATEREVAAVVLESPFSSLESLVAEKGLPAFLLRDSFDNVAAISELEAPLFLYHGTQDTLISVSHSETLAEKAADVTFLTADCGHNDCPRPWPQLLDFFRSNGILGREDLANP